MLGELVKRSPEKASTLLSTELISEIVDQVGPDTVSILSLLSVVLPIEDQEISSNLISFLVNILG